MLHVGVTRTAIFNWLFARHFGGTFLLRIEDTDRERSTPEAVESILDGLSWLGLDPDEAPVRQSERRAIYDRYVAQLLEADLAYPCTCTEVDLAERRNRARREGRAWAYEGTCADLSPGDRERLRAEGRPFAIRLRVPPGETRFDDLVHGPVTFDNATVGDFVIVRSNGDPVYHLTVVVDDALMGITHVLRGDDILSSTPRHILLFGALGFETPVFGHLPSVLGPDKAKLSKRHGATSIQEYRRRGYLAEALVNFLALLCWSPGDGREKMLPGELVEAFTIERVNPKPAIFDEKKLEWLNAAYLTDLSAEALFDAVVAQWVDAGLVGEDETGPRRDRLLSVIEAVKPRTHLLPDFVDLGRYFFEAPRAYDEKARRKHWKGAETPDRLRQIAERFEALATFDEGASEAALRGLAEALGISAAKLIHPVRLAVSGMAFGPGLFELLELLGRENVVERCRGAADWIERQGRAARISA
jgi:glutamyl-tRNA synthetase